MPSTLHVSGGTAHRNTIVLPRTDGIDDQHIHLHFEMQTSLLPLSDQSSAGTWISQQGLTARIWRLEGGFIMRQVSVNI